MNKQQFKSVVGGRFFSVTFLKRDGTIRKLNGRLGVTKHLKGCDRTIPDNIVVVYDLQAKGYRSFDITRLLTINGKDINRED